MKKILIVDDEKNLVESTSLVLEMAGYETEIAKDGQEAIDKIRDANEKSNPIDLVLTDIQMPNVNGIELIERINRDKLSIPVIVMSGYGCEKTMRELLSEGFVDYLIKPFDPNDLVMRIKNHFPGQLDHGLGNF